MAMSGQVLLSEVESTTLRFQYFVNLSHVSQSVLRKRWSLTILTHLRNFLSCRMSPVHHWRRRFFSSLDT